ncbi:MAG: hypothetical protein U9Q03_03635 [Patescibacteria group bacterium]|nr:hypothetical protein [Patescibacteria group bacterium]
MCLMMDVALYLLPVVLFLPASFLLLRLSKKNGPYSDNGRCPRSASVLLLCVLGALLIGWMSAGLPLLRTLIY